MRDSSRLQAACATIPASQPASQLAHSHARLRARSPAMAGSSSASKVYEKQQDLANQYQTHREEVTQLQDRAIQDLLPSLSEQEDWDEDAQTKVKLFLDDEATVFRFLRRSRFDPDAALSLLSTTLKWRVRTDLDMLSVTSLHPLYTSPPGGRPPLLWLGSKFVDRLGRPCGLISLQSLERTQDRTLDECKEYIVACMEIVRRRIVELRRQFDATSADATTQTSNGPLQLVIAFDLQSSSMSNLELELLPFLLDLLKNHFPGMVGAVFVLHYGWVHAGMWGLAKRILPAQALAKIFFPNDAEFAEFFDPQRVPATLQIGNGAWDTAIDESTNDVMARLGRPHLDREKAGGSAPSSPTDSPMLSRRGHISRGGSFESLADTYFSAAATPRGTTGQSRALTPRGSEPSTPRGTPNAQSSALEMTPSAAKKLRVLQMTRGHSDTTTATAASLAKTHRERADSSSAAAARARKDVEGRQTAASASASASTSTPIPRNRSLRDFRLLDGDDDGGGDDDDSDNDSDRSGKTGEMNIRDVRENAATAATSTSGSRLGRVGGLLSISQWRRGASGSGTRAGDEGAGDADKRRQQEEYSQELAAQQRQQREAVSGLHAAPTSPRLQLPDDVLPAEPPIAASSSKYGHRPLPTVDPHRPPRFLSRRSRKLANVPGAVSPYNASNPFWGYPAWIVEGDDEEGGGGDEGDDGGASTSRQTQTLRPPRPRRSSSRAPVQMTVRRRWRDLFRTLAYLFVLRILSAHRNLRWKVQLLAASLRSTLQFRPKPSSGTIAALEAENTAVAATDAAYDERTERHRRLRAASVRFRRQQQQQQRNGSGTASTTRRVARNTRGSPLLSTTNVSLALFVFAAVLFVRLRARRGLVRDGLGLVKARVAAVGAAKGPAAAAAR